MAGARGLGLVLLLAACASGGKPAGDATPVAPARSATVRTNADIILPEEIAAARATDAYDAIMRLRPRFLAPHASMDSRRSEGVQVVVDGVTLRGSSELRTVPASSIVYIRYLSELEASTNWGGSFKTPVVYVLTRAGPPPS